MKEIMEKIRDAGAPINKQKAPSSDAGPHGPQPPMKEAQIKLGANTNDMADCRNSLLASAVMIACR